MPEYVIVDGHPGYRVGDDGSVWSRKLRGSSGGIGDEWKPVKPYRINGKPHLFVSLRDRGRQHIRAVHQLVAEAFLGPRPPGLMCCHRNGDATDNRRENLRYDTAKANVRDSIEHGTFPSAERNGKAKLTIGVAREIRRRAESGESRASIAASLGIDASRVSKIVLGKLWADA